MAGRNKLDTDSKAKAESVNETFEQRYERYRKLLIAPENESVDQRYDRYQALGNLLEADSRPLNRALTEVNKKHGVTFAGGNIGVWGLVNSGPGLTYPHLIGTLIDHFQLPYMVRTKEGIARALICKEAKNTEAPVVLMRELILLHTPNHTHESGLRWTIIYALSFIGDTRQVEETKKLIEDERYADVREDLEKMLAKIQKRKWKPKKSES